MIPLLSDGFQGTRPAIYPLLPPMLIITPLFAICVSTSRNAIKETTEDFLGYKPTVLSPLHVGGSLIERVSSHKLLGVIITNNLSWNKHCDYTYSKANKRLFGLRVLKKSGLCPSDLVEVYCSIIKSVLNTPYRCGRCFPYISVTYLNLSREKHWK